MRSTPALALTNRDQILIGSFANSTSEPVFDETLSTALKVQLGQSPFLDIVPEDRISEELTLMQRPADERLTHDTAREVCERLGVKAMLDGTIARLGQNYVLDAQCDRLPHRRLGRPRAARVAEPRGGARRARHDGVDDAHASSANRCRRSSSSTCRSSRRRRRRCRR